ncbi:MAG: hypothetical protein M3N19_06455 [Candidatus Eremiobacteraeota bacterium]|nr:hypothetical protein [Candidatus Eremiobacteraeota bacterium]
MRHFIIALVFVFNCTAIATAGQVSATLIPDGLYSVKVEKVKSRTVIAVEMENGLHVEVQAAAHTNVSFEGVAKNGRLKIMIVEGQVVGVVR